MLVDTYTAEPSHGLSSDYLYRDYAWKTTIPVMKPKSLALIFAVLVVPSIIAEPISTRTPAYDELKSKRARPGPYEYEYVPGERSSEVQGPFYFPQTINHNIREKPPRVFDQRYWVNDQYYRKGNRICTLYPLPRIASHIFPLGRPVFLIIANAKDAKGHFPFVRYLHGTELNRPSFR